MRRNQKGFSLVETLVIIVVLGLIGSIGWHLYQTHHNDTKPVATQPGWLTFKSTKSNITFSYPSTWKIRQSESSSGESATLYGPNHFQMYFTLQNDYFSTADCTTTTYGAVLPPVTLSNGYKILAEAYGLDKQTVNGIDLGTTSQSTPTRFRICGVGNPVGAKLFFTFQGLYTTQSGSLSPKPATTFYSLPEVQTAKTMFTSLRPEVGAASNSATSAPSQCGCQEGNTCADISACEGQATPSQP
jgi:hypothetical protein